MDKNEKKKEFESTNSVDAPAERLQNEQTSDKVAKTNATVTPDNNFQVKPVKQTGSQLKQEVAATIIGKNVAGASGSSQVVSATKAGMKSGSYSGDAGTLLGGAAYTPVMDKSSQGKTRVDKRLSDANKDINYLAAEQYVTEFHNIEPLAISKETVGYNGNPMNIAARSQKTNGCTPAELEYDRSLDEDRVDKVIFVAGQTIKQSGVAYLDYPSKTYVYDANKGRYVPGVFTSGKEPIRGNFAPRRIEAKFKKENGQIFLSSFKVIEDDLSITTNDYETVNKSSANFKIDLNQAELARQRIDDNAGAPTSDKYNPLGRSVAEPTRTVMFLRDRELGVGATMVAGLRFALKSRAYYLSRTGKDGQDEITPAIDALYGHLTGSTDPTELRSLITVNPDGEITNKDANAYGSANLLLYVTDSIRKYKTKGDLVNQPRGLKLFLGTGLNNKTPFRYKKEFLKALNANDYFSTIDRGYDPGSLTVVTDGVRLVYPYSWARSLEFTREHAGDNRTYQSELFIYGYQAGSGNQSYVIKAADPILNGVAWYLEQHAASIFSAIGSNQNDVERTLFIPTVHYGAHFGLWDLLLCASAPYIEYERTNAFKDILDYEDKVSYPFPELETISDDAVRSPKNYGRISEYEKLTVEQMKPEDAIRYIMPAKIIPMRNDFALLPFNFNEASFDISKNGSKHYVKANGSHDFSTPVIRSGVRLAYLDDFFAMEPKDLMLSYDFMTKVPGEINAPADHEGRFYKYSKAEDGLVMIKADAITVADWLKTPKQLGWFLDAPAGYCRRNHHTNELGSIGEVMSSTIVSLASSNVARTYHGLKPSPTTILGNEAMTVDRAQAFTQTWADCASYSYGRTSSRFDLTMGLEDIFALSSSSITLTGVDKAVCSPFVGANGEHIQDFSLGTLMCSLWTRIQKLPFVINPYEDRTGKHNVDPLDFCHIFGLAGFLAANYDEEYYNRINEYQDYMFGFTEDPYVVASPVFR